MTKVKASTPEAVAPKLFISYARKDARPLAVRLQSALRANGHDAWLDEQQIEGGASLGITIEQAIDQSDILLALLTHGSYTSPICRAEQRRALRVGKRVIPLLAQTNADRPLYLEDSRYVELRDDASFEQGFAVLLADIGSGKAAASTKPLSSTRLITVPPLPPNFIARPEDLERLRDAAMAEDGAQRVALTALAGMGGIGKSVLAAALCRDSMIQEAYPDGIVWVTIGRDPGNLTTQITEIGRALGDTQERYDTPEAARNRLRTVLSDKAVLLVLDDVWDARHVDPFRMDAPRCRTLFTTRDSNIALALAAQEIKLGTMSEAQSVALLREWVKRDDPGLADIARRVGYLPVALRIAGAHLQEGMPGSEWLADFQRVVDVRLGRYSNASDENLQVCFDLSFADERVKHDRPLYDALGVFPEDLAVPEIVVVKLWRGLQPNLSGRDAKELLREFARRALLERNADGAVTLHDLLYDYARERLGEDAPAKHAALLATYNPRGKAWADVEDDGYLYLHLAHHLIGAQREAELTETLKDMRFLPAKTLKYRSWVVEADLRLAQVAAPNDQILRQLVKSFAQAGHLLNAAQNLDDMLTALASRLAHRVPELAQRLIASIQPPYLTAAHPLPDLQHPALTRTLRGHTDKVTCCAVSRDGNQIVSGCLDGTLKVWDAKSGREKGTLFHGGPVIGCAFTADDESIISASSHGKLTVWDAASGSEKFSFAHSPRGFACCAVSSDGHSIACVDRTTVRVWKVRNGAERVTIAHELKLSIWLPNVSLSPDGRWVAAIMGGTLKVWDVLTGIERFTLSNRVYKLAHCVASPDGQFLLSASRDGVLKVWDAVSGAEKSTLGGQAGYLRGCAVSPDGRLIVSFDDHGLKGWDVASGAEKFTLQGHAGPTRACAVSPDGEWIVSASDDCTLKVWDCASDANSSVLGQSANSFCDTRACAVLPFEQRITSGCAVFPDGQRIISAWSDGTLTVWDTRSGAQLMILAGHSREVSSCAVSPDGRWIVSASYDRTLKVWDVATGAERFFLAGHKGPVTGCAVSPNGLLIVSASTDKTLRVWDAVNGQGKSTFDNLQRQYKAPEGNWSQQITADRTLRAWRKTESIVGEISPGHSKALTGCAVSQDGRWIVSASEDETLKVWDLVSGAEKFTLAGHMRGVTGCAVSPDGQWIVSASHDNTLKVWDAASGAEKCTLAGHTSQVSGCAVSPDGQWIVSASHDNTLKVWDALSGACATTLYVDGPLSCCAWHPDGERIFARGAQGVYWLKFVK